MIIGNAISHFRVRAPGGVGVDPVFDTLAMGYNADTDASDVLGVNNGVLTNGAGAAGVGIINEAFTFDGTNDYVSLPDDSFIPSGEFAVSLWADIKDSSGNHAFYSNINFSSGFMIYQSGVRLRVEMITTGGSFLLSNIFVGTGYKHIVLRRSATLGYELIVDNVSSELNASTDPVAYSSINYSTIGASRRGAASFQNFSDRNVDAVYLFNSRLTDADITTLYNGGAGLQY